MPGKYLWLHTRPAPMRRARDAAEDYGVGALPDWREVDWRNHLRQAEIAGRTLNYVDIGPTDAVADESAEPLLMIHGLGGSWQNWLENIPFFAQRRRVIAPDLPGHGYSEMPAEPISAQGFADAMDALCEHAGVEQAMVVGNSMGGFVSVELAVRHPERVERLCLVSPAGISVTKLQRAPLLTIARAFVAVSAREVVEHARLLRRARLRHLIFASVFRHPTRMAPDLLYEQMHGAGTDGFVPSLEMLLTYDFAPRLPKVSCPTLLVWGREDALVPVSDGEEFERAIPDARLVVFDETGHCTMIERPRTFNELLENFLEDRDAARDQTEAESREEGRLARGGDLSREEGGEGRDTPDAAGANGARPGARDRAPTA